MGAELQSCLQQPCNVVQCQYIPIQWSWLGLKQSDFRQPQERAHKTCVGDPSPHWYVIVARPHLGAWPQWQQCLGATPSPERLPASVAAIAWSRVAPNVYWCSRARSGFQCVQWWPGLEQFQASAAATTGLSRATNLLHPHSWTLYSCWPLPPPWPA